MSRHYDMYCKEFQENRRANSCIHSLRSEVKQLQTELDNHRWIPVAEGLPGKPVKVNVCNTDVGYVGHCRYLVDKKKWASGRDYTHWKPAILPEQVSKGVKP